MNQASGSKQRGWYEPRVWYEGEPQNQQTYERGRFRPELTQIVRLTRTLREKKQREVKLADREHADAVNQIERAHTVFA